MKSWSDIRRNAVTGHRRSCLVVRKAEAKENREDLMI